MKRFFLSILVTALLGACSDNTDKNKAEMARQQRVADSLALKVAVTPTLDCLPLYLAQERGMFEQQGVSVKLMPYMAQMDQDTALMNQRVEGMTTDRIRAEWLRGQGMQLREVASTTLKWQMLTNKMARIKLLSQLEDKMVAMTRFSATDMLAQKAADSAGVASEHIFRIQINDICLRLEMLEAGSMDAMLLPEPQATQARMGGHNVLMDTDDMGLCLGTIVFTETVMADSMRSQQIEKFLNVYNTACDSIRKNGWASYRDIITRYCHVKPNVADSIPSLRNYPDN